MKIPLAIYYLSDIFSRPYLVRSRLCSLSESVFRDIWR